MKPAFVDDMMSLAIGPLFVLTEAYFLLGLKRELRRHIEDRVGPTMRERNGKMLQPSIIATTNHI